MDTRERVRRRLEAFFQREDAPTQADAAKRLGMSQGGFSKLLARGPVLEHLDVLADIMGCTVADLVAPGSALTSAPVRDLSHPDAPDLGLDPALLAPLRELALAMRPLLQDPDAFKQFCEAATYWGRLNTPERAPFLGLMHDALEHKVVDARHIPRARHA